MLYMCLFYNPDLKIIGVLDRERGGSEKDSDRKSRRGKTSITKDILDSSAWVPNVIPHCLVRASMSLP